jgi:rare lipoprotein A
MLRRLAPAAAAVLLMLTAGCALVARPVYRSGGLTASAGIPGLRMRGIASYYGPGFQGKLTASGETFDMNAMTCAHLTLPFGTVLRVTNLGNDREVVVRVNDRGPYVGGRIIDLSRRAADELGMMETGTAEVVLQVMGGQEDD